MHKPGMNRIATLLVPLSAIVMEVCWGYPWLIWTGKWETLHWGAPPLTGFALLFLVSISFLLTRFLINRSWSNLATKLAMAGIGLVIVFVVIRIEYGYDIEPFSGYWFVYIGRIILNSFSQFNSIVLALPAAAYFWWRGMLLGRKEEYNYISSNVVFGAGSFVILGFIWWATMGTTSFGDMTDAIGIYVAAFFFFGLIGTSLNNLRNVQKRMKPDEIQPISYGRWVPLVVGLVTVIIAIGGFIATITSLDIAGYIKRSGSTISHWLEIVLPWLALPLKYILMPFEWLAREIFELLIRLFGVRSIEPEGEQGAGEVTPEIVPGATPEDWLRIIKWALFIIVVIVVTILIARSIERSRRRRMETTPDIEESRESLWSWRMLFNGLIQFFIRIFGRFMPKREGKEERLPGSMPVSQTESSVTTLKIRDIFKHLLRDASKIGIGRRRSETPFEYAQRFSKEIPETNQPMQELTNLYVQVRYSDSDAGNEQIIQANSLWKQIKEYMKQLKTDKN